MKTEQEIRAEYELVFALEYERAIQSGLDHQTATHIAQQAQLQRAKDEITRILPGKLGEIIIKSTR